MLIKTWSRQSTSRRYYPTRLATTLTSNAMPLVSSEHDDDEKGFLVLETNYRLYAYTSASEVFLLSRFGAEMLKGIVCVCVSVRTGNPLQIAVLNLFATLRSRFPNFVVGMITRESVKQALANGIQAEQIVSYLTVHAHPQMRRQVRVSLAAAQM
jgi:transcription initiation factor TFIIH subunit 4